MPSSFLWAEHSQYCQFTKCHSDFKKVSFCIFLKKSWLACTSSICGNIRNGLCHLSCLECVCGKILSFIFFIIYILLAWRDSMQLVVSLELGGECVWKGFYLLSLSFFILLLLFYLVIFCLFYLLSVWRSFMQWVVSLELPGECVWKGFIFPRDISVCTRHTQTIYSFSSSNSFYLISFWNN